MGLAGCGRLFGRVPSVSLDPRTDQGGSSVVSRDSWSATTDSRMLRVLAIVVAVVYAAATFGCGVVTLSSLHIAGTLVNVIVAVLSAMVAVGVYQGAKPRTVIRGGK